MKYNFDEIIDRKSNHSTKYNELVKKFGTDDIIPLWIADMDFKTADPIIKALEEKAKHGIFGYVYRPEEYFGSFIDWQKKQYNWKVKEELLSFSIGVVPALATLVRQFSEKGDKILIQTPVYSEFYDINHDNERFVIENKFIEKNGKYYFDLEDFENKLKEQPKLFILCNPQNPIGHVWNYNELKSMGDLCIKYNVPVISDEIHADLTLWNNKHIPMASVSEEISKNTITCTSIGKAFNVAGLQCATVVFNNTQEKNKFDKFWKNLEVHRNNPFNLVATIAAYTEGEEYLSQLKQYLEDNIMFVYNYFKENIPLIKPNIPQATYLIWLDCRNLNLNQEELEKFMLKKAKLGLNSGRAFQKDLQGFMRLNAACPRGVLEKALNQLKDAVNTLISP
ncbi:pyridoxal phosphate-dependent aminotransferase [Leptotrichia sp. OH3620_COT-345]|uniref:MalY/PatB family protein n=1 Tax=Leptotrichia sp. OH3620_COT-345 TaxID=2491048 RepID=UPI000F655262|nr:MalY/PatB family protein [Leptotrichia sp. OH3620_COT-345]RRD38736.1 pyridoxal phosphate-dependent aminotransferase [Leptotrichia sp. OH3620_COT-345]